METITTPMVVGSISISGVTQKMLVIFEQIMTPTGAANDVYGLIVLGATGVVLEVEIDLI